MEIFAIIEIGSNNTKTHVYKDNAVIFDSNTTIEFKKHYNLNKKILDEDLNILYEVIKNALKYTPHVYVYGCSIFRNISDNDLTQINNKLREQFNVEIKVQGTS